MSRGIVLWPDPDTGRVINEIWDAIAALGLPSMATHTHRQHRPHVSLVVAEDLDAKAARDAVGSVPREPIRLSVSAAGVFPGGVLTLVCDPDRPLLQEQLRVHEAVVPLATDPWPHYHPGRWTPHITVAMDLTTPQLTVALPEVLDRLPIAGLLDAGGVEDGTTGERWPSQEHPAGPSS
ncbi:MAG TPA: 2'-5' RNA ligase family protein [Acidimicrobiales bacterium]|nr:2'-5' RNA ligase family protein [Acidimicrobiales bacterium]